MTENEVTFSEESRSELFVYRNENWQVKLEVHLEDETIWLTQKMMAELFTTTKQNISQHIQAIYEKGELQSEATVKKFLTVQQEENQAAETLKKKLATIERLFYSIFNIPAMPLPIVRHAHFGGFFYARRCRV